MDIKSLLFGSILSFAVGGGIYGFYFKQAAPAAFYQVTGYELIEKCFVYRSNPDLIPVKLKEIESFLEIVKSKYPDIAKSDAVVATISMATGEKEHITTGMGTQLQTCIRDLIKDIEKLKK